MQILKKLIMAVTLIATVGCSACTPEIENPAETAVVDPTTGWDETCSYEQGNHACDFTLQDQNGDDWNLYDHYGKTIVLDFSTMWCGYCQYAAKEVREVQDVYADDLIYVTVLIENLGGMPPDVDDLNDWATIFGITNAPVLGGSRDMLESAGTDGWYVTSWPTFYFLTDELVIHTSD